ncbi:hypothetical protein GCM10018980_20910 [Streptomyces capoamus]|uniref:Uncharacterized protein n=1 Tax=Streptomyces capoamus TaxID=68183 RepID=A0A919EUZ1_9ACTN|nr:hypothetical protein [Streptomyces capoamus]GGW09778.1 hypothetical protein GCM10010501_02950 [Streptomyces libani subsp. rufus]GHG43768.1 hypothetical protein GCM10018980_20910 [Streptomyces capoamus]
MCTTTDEEVIALEQKAVGHAYYCCEARLVEMSGNSAATASASGKDSIAALKAAEARAEVYGGLGNEALVFARVGAPEEPGGSPAPGTSAAAEIMEFVAPLARAIAPDLPYRRRCARRARTRYGP